MYNTKNSYQTDLPSSKQLIRSTIIAATVALVMLITVILPAEYGIDPTRLGSALGLTKMGEIKVSLSEEAARDAQADAVQREIAQNTANRNNQIPTPINAQTHQMTITLKPDQAAEVKLTMTQGAKATYQWTADGPVNFDAHGDPVNKPQGFYHGYGKGRQVQEDKGVLQAAFDGKHGWFWRNRSENNVTVTLTTSGDYQAIKRVL